MIAWIAFILSTIGIILNAKKKIWCWPIWIASNVLWIIHTTTIHDNAALMTWAIFLMFNFYGWYEWYLASHGKLKPFKRDRLFIHEKYIGNEKWTVTNDATPEGYEVRLSWKCGFRPTRVFDKFVTLNYDRAKKMELEFCQKMLLISLEKKSG